MPAARTAPAGTGHRLTVIIESDQERDSLGAVLKAREQVGWLLSAYHGGGSSRPAATTVWAALRRLARAEARDDQAMADAVFAVVAHGRAALLPPRGQRVGDRVESRVQRDQTTEWRASDLPPAP